MPFLNDETSSLRGYAGASFFSKSALRTQYFIGDTVFLYFVLLALGVTVARYWSVLPAFSRFLLAGVGFCLASFWTGVLRTHSAYHKLITSTNFEAPKPGTVEDLALGTLAALSFQGLLSAAGLVMLCLMALVEILASR